MRRFSVLFVSAITNIHESINMLSFLFRRTFNLIFQQHKNTSKSQYHTEENNQPGFAYVVPNTIPSLVVTGSAIQHSRITQFLCKFHYLRISFRSSNFHFGDYYSQRRIVYWKTDIWRWHLPKCRNVKMNTFNSTSIRPINNQIQIKQISHKWNVCV